MNNYIKRSFGIIKDIIFARTQAYNLIQHPEILCIAKRFLCPGLETIDANMIQKMNVKNESSILSTKENNIYIVNSEIGAFSYTIGMSSTPWPDDRIVYAYIALGYISENRSFYASLYAQPANKNTHTEIEISSDNFNKTLSNSLINETLSDSLIDETLSDSLINETLTIV
ncbi:23708_t:CDS:2 [Dentiscutata erythropus]|uniref:23708_t:CDS:1 n=1 Tax=Dentiscutata erythropus TaxID=1348616 RepID=A0A9N9BCG8_9GLOM|nr:23708_t:CDS:2 [Dentiscutata erythropus]